MERKSHAENNDSQSQMIDNNRIDQSQIYPVTQIDSSNIKMRDDFNNLRSQEDEQAIRREEAKIFVTGMQPKSSA